MESVLHIFGVIVLVLIIVPFVVYTLGFMFGRGFLSGMSEYFKIKKNKNEQKEEK